MLITRIELENIKSYRHILVNFQRGTTAISGANGAGKTTLVEAIGFALFNYLPYSQDQFVREGEKYGKVVVNLIGSDERPYTVERRCGSGARWQVYDQEADMRLEQRTDVLDKLHDLFGIDRERPLDSLFRDALGVPQGTFTSIFLEASSKRKQTFDALLQIEDYKTAADKLLDTQKYYKEQMGLQQIEIQRLSFATSELEAWRAQLKEARLLDEQQKTQNATWSQLLSQQEARATLLQEQFVQLSELKQRYQSCLTNHEHAQNILHDRKQQLHIANVAQQIVSENLSAYNLYLHAQENLKQMRQRVSQRDMLRQRYARYQNDLTKAETQAQNWLERLERVTIARQLVVKLAPAVEQQIEMESRRDEATRRVYQYNTVIAEEERLQAQLAKYQRDLKKYLQHVTEIEPLVPLADCLHERSEALTQLRIHLSERSSKQRLLQEKRDQLRERQLACDQTAEKVRKAENNLLVIEEHRVEAEEMPVLKERYDLLVAQKSRLEGNIDGYRKSRAQSAGGQCPLLYESCLNIRQRGLVSLESYFDSLLTEEYTQVEQLSEQQDVLKIRMGQIRKFAEALTRFGEYVAQRDERAEKLQGLASEIKRLERDIASLLEDLNVLKRVEQQVSEADRAYNESKEADSSVRGLDGLRKQVQHCYEQMGQLESEIQERQRLVAQLQGSSAQLEQIELKIKALNDPRSQNKAQLALIVEEGSFQQQLQVAQQKQEEVLQQLHVLDEQLGAYASLDGDIAEQERYSQQSYQGYQKYLQNEKEAQRLPECERVYQLQLQAAEQAFQQLQAIEQAYHDADAAFNQVELEALRLQIERLGNDLARLAQRMQRHQQDINALEQQIEKAEALVVELEAAQSEYHALEDLHSMTEQFRKVIKEAAPHVLKAMLADISAEANRIFGEVIGDRSAQLSWRNDYEIILRRQAVDRSFAQLSGGEQMSAALSVRLALLKKLSTLNIAFFDEPTQNMDEDRRMNLAEQIRRVRGFDQLLVISHDDTFEQGLDGLVRLRKVNNETHLLEEGSGFQTESGFSTASAAQFITYDSTTA